MKSIFFQSNLQTATRNYLQKAKLIALCCLRHTGWARKSLHVMQTTLHGLWNTTCGLTVSCMPSHTVCETFWARYGTWQLRGFIYCIALAKNTMSEIAQVILIYGWRRTREVMLLCTSLHYSCFPRSLDCSFCNGCSNQLQSHPDHFKSLTRHFPFLVTLLFQKNSFQDLEIQMPSFLDNRHT